MSDTFSGFSLAQARIAEIQSRFMPTPVPPKKANDEFAAALANAQGSQLCVYDEDMVAFVRKQGDLSQMKWSRQ